MNLLYCIAGHVKALHSTWFLGDDSLRRFFDTFTDTRKSAKDENRQLPYLFDYYNVESFHALQLLNNRSVLVRIINTLTKEMNSPTHQHLPCYIVILLDKDLVHEANVFDFGVSETLEDIIKWLLINVNRCVELRKEDLRGRRPGAISTEAEPHLILVNMLRRPDHSMDKRVYCLARKYNSVMEKVIAGDKRSHILKIHVDLHEGNFDRVGNLTMAGKHEFWKCIDNEMKDFDQGKTELAPRSADSNCNTSLNVTHSLKPVHGQTSHCSIFRRNNCYHLFNDSHRKY